jgi:hypothetical protein
MIIDNVTDEFVSKTHRLSFQGLLELKWRAGDELGKGKSGRNGQREDKGRGGEERGKE